MSRPGKAAPSRARVLVPVCLLILFESLGSRQLSFAALNSAHAAAADSTRELAAYLSLGGGLLGAIAGLVGGDGRGARHVVWVCLGVMVYAGVTNFVHPTPWLIHATPAVTALTSVCTTLVAMGYALRTGPVRQSYLVIALLYLMWFASRMIALFLRDFFEDYAQVFLSGVICTALAIAAGLMLVRPGTEPHPAAQQDPAPARPRRPAVILLIVLLGLFNGTSFTRYITTIFPGTVLVHLTQAAREHHELLRTVTHAMPSVLCFGVLILAAARWWRPSLLVGAGMLLTAIGLASAGLLPEPTIGDGPTATLALHLASGFAMDVGRGALYGAAWWVLLRQLVPRSRVVRWAAVVYLLDYAMDFLLPLVAFGLGGDQTRRIFALLFAALMLGAGIALLRFLKRYRFLPLRPT